MFGGEVAAGHGHMRLEWPPPEGDGGTAGEAVIGGDKIFAPYLRVIENVAKLP